MLDEYCIINDLAYLKRQAERCARLAAGLNDRSASALLETMSREYAKMAEMQEGQTLGEGRHRPDL
jgi:hypothetical protein